VCERERTTDRRAAKGIIEEEEVSRTGAAAIRGGDHLSQSRSYYVTNTRRSGGGVRRDAGIHQLSEQSDCAWDSLIISESWRECPSIQPFYRIIAHKAHFNVK
jgi:hypothetical protein